MYRAGKKLEMKNNKKCRFPASRLNFEALCSLPPNPNLNSQLKFDENFSNARRRIWSHPYIFVHIWFELFRIKLAKQYCISWALHAESDFQKLVFCYVQELPDKLRILSFYTQRLVLLSRSGDLGIGLVWDNNRTPPDPTGPQLFGPTVEILFKLN